MKKVLAIFLFLICLFTVGCTKEKVDESKVETSNVSKVNEENIIEIKEKMFIAQCNDIYLNPKDYEGKTIKLEGIYDESTDPETKEKFHFVMRNGPGCCGNDGVAGFQFKYSGSMPKVNDWVEAIGTIETVDENDYVILNVTKLTVLKVRGAEFVSE